ncbi:MAG: hypothetical protein IJK62_05690 [Bacteroidales bacterium]|nr:hypothetical protein [Bacteroidales bacterium]
MRKIVTSVVLLFCMIALYGQKYTPYIIITKKGERIECLAEMKKDFITYRLGPKTEKVKLYSNEVKYAASVEGDSIMLFSGIPVYTSLSQTSPTNVGWVRFLTDPRVEPVSIYVYYSTFLGQVQENYGCYRQGDEYGQNLIASNTFKAKYKETISKYFSDCPSLVEYINGDDFRLLNLTGQVKYDDFKNVVQEYNQCEDKK